MAAAIPIIAGILSIGGTAVQTVAAFKQADANADAQEHAARQAEENAKLEVEKAGEDERTFRAFSRKAISDIRTGYAASGVSLEGSATDVLSSSAAEAEYDALKIRRGGEMRAKGLKSDADFYNTAAGSTRTGGYLSGVGTAVKGAVKGYSYFDDYFAPKRSS